MVSRGLRQADRCRIRAKAPTSIPAMGRGAQSALLVWGRQGSMSAQDQKTPSQPKAPERDNMRRDAEIESIKRTLYNAIDKLDKIQRRKAELITT